MKTLFKNENYKSNCSEYYEFVEHNGRKFKITLEIKNGDPCGFKSNQCVAVMTNDGGFTNVADGLMVCGIYRNDYYSDPIMKRQYTEMMVKNFKNFIEKVY